MSRNICQSIIILFLISFAFNGCGKIGGVDAKKFPPDPKQRVKNNLESGKGFRIMDKIKGGSGNGGNFEFANSNELWRASLDVIDFMPLSSVNYSGGIIVTDWYSNNEDGNESVTCSRGDGYAFNILRGYIRTYRFKLSIRQKGKVNQKTIEEALGRFNVQDYVEYNPSSD